MKRASALLASAAVFSLSSIASISCPSQVQAEEAPASCLSAIRRLPGLTDRLGCPLALGAGAGYGYTGAVLEQGDAHHRLLGALAAEWSALPALVLGLRLEGRYDRHVLPQSPRTVDDGWTGEPRLSARWQQGGPGTRWGLALGVNLPGGQAPSVDLGAVGGELAALGTRALGALELTGKLGYRLDRSANAVPGTQGLSPADRVGLGVNAFDALLVGLAGERRLRAVALFAEVTLDVLLGAPAAQTWPLRLGGGVRRALGKDLFGELLLEAALSRQPPQRPSDPLIEVPPRIALLAGLTWGQGAAARAPALPSAAPPPVAPVEVTRPRPRGQLRGSVRSYGGRGIPATIHISGTAAATSDPATLDSRAGEFELDLAPGTYEVVIEAESFVTQRRRITVEENGVVLLNVDLRRAR